MSLKQIYRDYFRKEILVIFFLGMASGLPFILIMSTLKVLLVDRHIDLATIGFFSLISIFYSIKFFWAPLVDSIPIPYLTNKLGRRRSWIITTQLALIISINLLGFYGQNGTLLYVTIFATLTAFFSATQDIVIDAYRIEIVKKEDQGIAAAFYVYGYRISILIAGAGALILSDHIKWDHVYYLMSLIILIGMVAVFFANENPCPTSNKNLGFLLWFRNSVISPFIDFLRRPKWYIIFPFILCFKLGDAFAGVLTLPFLLDIGFSKTEIAGIVKTFGLFATLIGVLFGGILVKSLKLNKSLWVAAILQMISNLAFYYQSSIGYNTTSLYFVVLIENFSGGMGDAIFVAYLSSLCNIAFTATQYAILISFATMGRAVLTSSSGILVGYLGWGNYFLFSTAIALPGLILLSLLRTTVITKQKG